MLNHNSQKRLHKISIILIFLSIINSTFGADADLEVKLIFKSNYLPAPLEYKYSTTKWEDIHKMLQGLPSGAITEQLITEICVRGTWLFYDQAHLINEKTDTLEGITLYTSDTETCIPKANIDHKLGSVQHVTSYTRRKSDSIAFFEYENFVGRKMLVHKPVKPVDELPGYYTFVKSLITVGKQEWEVVMEDKTGDGVVVLCISPPQTMDFPICLISNFIDGEKLVDGGILQLSHAKQNCLLPNINHIPIHLDKDNCYESTQGIVKPKPSGPFGPPKTNDTTGPEGCEDSNSTDVLTDEHISLIGGRLNGSLGDGNWFSAIKDPKQVWKAELFDKCFQILTRICPESVIDKEYLLLFASLYFHHLGKVWDSGKFLNVSISEVDWMEISHDMRACVKTTMDGDYDEIALTTSKELKTYKTLDDVTGKLQTMLGLRPEFDHVMEINWMMANLVASICTKARNYDVNFLPRFLNTFHILYFSPIEEQWKTPDTYVKVYKYLFGGYGMQKSMAKIALCTYNAMKFTKLTEPYKRPLEQVDKILLPKVQVE